MRANFGEHFKLTIFGESHGPAIGVVVDGLPAGARLDEAYIAGQMARRAPGGDPTATARKEADAVRILSGAMNGRATGAPLCAMIENTNTRSGDYAGMAARMRPGHADYAGYVKYRGMNDPRGGGHFSGRLTAPLVFAGSVARLLLREKGIEIGAHIAAIAGERDAQFDPVGVDARTLCGLAQSRFPLLNPEKEAPMRRAVAEARGAGQRRRGDRVRGGRRARGRRFAVLRLGGKCGEPTGVFCAGGEGDCVRRRHGAGGDARQRGERRDAHEWGRRDLRKQPQRRRDRRHHQRHAGDFPRGDQAHAVHRAGTADG